MSEERAALIQDAAEAVLGTYPTPPPAVALYGHLDLYAADLAGTLAHLDLLLAAAADRPNVHQSLLFVRTRLRAAQSAMTGARLRLSVEMLDEERAGGAS